MFVLLILSIITLVFLFYISKNKFDEYLNPLDRKEYKLKDYLGIGFYILSISGYKYNTFYDKTIRIKTAQLAGAKYADYYLYVHWANKITALAFVFVLVMLIGTSWGKFDVSFPVIAIVFLGGTFYGLDKELEKKIEKRIFSIKSDFPHFINKLTLLLNAGMTISSAWERIVIENQKDTPFYIEAQYTMEEINNGKSEVYAYEDFARRCRVSEVTKFVSILIQNLKKGSSQIVLTLSYMSSELWEIRKHIARRMGEEASTKLLFPMIFNFFVVVVIVALPAFMAMQQSI